MPQDLENPFRLRHYSRDYCILSVHEPVAAKSRKLDKDILGVPHPSLQCDETCPVIKFHVWRERRAEYAQPCEADGHEEDGLVCIRVPVLVSAHRRRAGHQRRAKDYCVICLGK